MVDGEDEGGAGTRHDEEGAVRHEPPAPQHLHRERECRRGGHGLSSCSRSVLCRSRGLSSAVLGSMDGTRDSNLYSLYP